MAENTPPLKGIARVSHALGEAASWLFVLATVITVYEVTMRYIFAAPTTWVHVTTTALCAVGFALGGAYAMVSGQHVRITSLLDKLPQRMQRPSELLGLACGVFYLGGLAYAAVLQAWEGVWHFEGKRWVPEAVPGPPHWPLPALTRVALAVGALLFLAMVLQRLVQVLRRKAA